MLPQRYAISLHRPGELTTGRKKERIFYMFNSWTETMAGSLRVRGKRLLQVFGLSVAITEHLHNVWRPSGDRSGLALSCFISNGRLRGGSVCQPREPPDSPHKRHMGSPASIPLAEPEQSQDQAPEPPALLVFPWQCHRACPAHCQLPTLGQRMQQPLPT